MACWNLCGHLVFFFQYHHQVLICPALGFMTRYLKTWDISAIYGCDLFRVLTGKLNKEKKDGDQKSNCNESTEIMFKIWLWLKLKSQITKQLSDVIVQLRPAVRASSLLVSVDALYSSLRHHFGLICFGLVTGSGLHHTTLLFILYFFLSTVHCYTPCVYCSIWVQLPWSYL